VRWAGSHLRVCAHRAAEQRLAKPAFEVDAAADAELLLFGEAARGLAGDGARRVVGSVPCAVTCWKRWCSGSSRKLMVLLPWVMLAGLL
jgi:hypothetical protein